jgi:hypothetical protein
LQLTATQKVSGVCQSWTENPRVGGSIPSLATLWNQPFDFNGKDLGKCPFVGAFLFQYVQFGPFLACWDNIGKTGTHLSFAGRAVFIDDLGGAVDRVL